MSMVRAGGVVGEGSSGNVNVYVNWGGLVVSSRIEGEERGSPSVLEYIIAHLSPFTVNMVVSSTASPLPLASEISCTFMDHIRLKPCHSTGKGRWEARLEAAMGIHTHRILRGSSMLIVFCDRHRICMMTMRRRCITRSTYSRFSCWYTSSHIALSQQR